MTRNHDSQEVKILFRVKKKTLLMHALVTISGLVIAVIVFSDSFLQIPLSEFAFCSGYTSNVDC